MQPTYAPSDIVSEALGNIDLIAIVGPTGVGKSTIIDKLDIPYVMSDVSREKRPDEKDQKNYVFRIDYLDILKEIKSGHYVQYLVSDYDEFYGTRLKSYPDRGHCVMAIRADVLDNFRELGFRSVAAIYIMPPSYVEWMRRIGGVRSDDLLARIDEARKSILLAVDDSRYKFILNDDLDTAVDEVKAIISGKETDSHRSQLAHDTADVLLERIGEE